MKMVVVGSRFQSPVLQSLARQNPAPRFFNEQTFAAAEIRFSGDEKIYLESAEAVLPELSKKRGFSENFNAVEALQKKSQLRILLKPTFPEFYFNQISLSDLRQQGLPGPGPYVLKPNRGFFGIGVRVIQNRPELELACREIEQELELLRPFFSPGTLSSTDDFLLEEYVEGEEYAVDMYFSKTGEPVIVNICHHPIHARKEYVHTLYYTSKEVFEKTSHLILAFFENLNTSKTFKNIPIHAEFRLAERLIPIEFNVLRFGGFAYTDLVQFAYGLDCAPDVGHFAHKVRVGFVASLFNFTSRNFSNSAGGRYPIPECNRFLL